MCLLFFFLYSARCACFSVYYLTALSLHCVVVSVTAILQWADRFVWWVGARVIRQSVTAEPLKGMTGHKCYRCDISQVKVKGNYEYEVDSELSSACECANALPHHRLARRRTSRKMHKFNLHLWWKTLSSLLPPGCCLCIYKSVFLNIFPAISCLRWASPPEAPLEWNALKCENLLRGESRK